VKETGEERLKSFKDFTENIPLRTAPDDKGKDLDR
jgi:hypothetical protein